MRRKSAARVRQPLEVARTEVHTLAPPPLTMTSMRHANATQLRVGEGGRNASHSGNRGNLRVSRTRTTFQSLLLDQTGRALSRLQLTHIILLASKREIDDNCADPSLQREGEKHRTRRIQSHKSSELSDWRMKEEVTTGHPLGDGQSARRALLLRDRASRRDIYHKPATEVSHPRRNPEQTTLIQEIFPSKTE